MKEASISEQDFRNAIMQAPVGFTVLRGKEMIVQSVNKAYLQIVDRKLKNFVGKSLYDSLPEVREAVEPILLSVLNTGEPFYGNEFEVTLNRFGQAEQAFFNFVYHPFRDNDGLITGVLVVATDVTSQVQAKMALEYRELQFRQLVMRSPIAMTILKGPEYIVEIANDTLLTQIWRKSLKEVEGKKLLEIFPELKDQQFPRLLKNVRKTGTTYQEKEALATINSTDGQRDYYLNFTYAPLIDQNGHVESIMVTVNDVTDEVRTRQAIEDAEKRYRTLIDTLPIAVFTVDQDGYIDLYNKAAIDLWGYAPLLNSVQWSGAKALLTLDNKLINEKDNPMALTMKKNVRSNNLEYLVEHADGSLRHVVSHHQLILDGSDNTIGALNVLVDVTASKEVESALRGSEEKFRVLANSMPQFIWTADPQGNLSYFSQSVYDYSGLNEVSIFEKGWLEIVHPDDRQKNVDNWMKAIKSGKDFIYQHRFRRFDGEYRWQLSRAVPQKDENGTIQMWVGTSTDIHETRLFADELTEKVSERTKELQTSNENLLRSNAELVQFAYVASHDLQEPLRKIQTFISRVIDMDFDHLSEKGRDYLLRTQNSAIRTQRLLKDLLAFSRANTMEKLFELTNLNELFDKIVYEVQDEVEQKNVKITKVKMPKLKVIPFQFEQLFINLLTNSLKFSRKDRDLEITLKADKKKGSALNHQELAPKQTYHILSFSDNGIGFDPKHSDRIFRVFQRLNNREEYEGTGIGLAICKKIVENHNGFIKADSKEGEGATITIYLPAK